MVLKKERKDKDKVLFIDASQHFEKVKTQNYLREADISKIMDTYKKYLSSSESGLKGVLEDKFAYIASLEELAENDYNLNIPRYVDTFEEEAPVDLAAVSMELKALNKDMVSTNATIADFCEQLGINTPF